MEIPQRTEIILEMSNWVMISMWTEQWNHLLFISLYRTLSGRRRCNVEHATTQPPCLDYTHSKHCPHSVCHMLFPSSMGPLRSWGEKSAPKIQISYEVVTKTRIILDKTARQHSLASKLKVQQESWQLSSRFKEESFFLCACLMKIMRSYLPLFLLFFHSIHYGNLAWTMKGVQAAQLRAFFCCYSRVAVG